jgi:hypothetical protein
MNTISDIKNSLSNEDMYKRVIIPTTYSPSAEIKTINHLVITLNGKPLLGLGEYEDDDTQNEANNLIKSESFKLLVDAYCGFQSDNLGIKKIHGSRIPWKEEEFCIAKNNNNTDLHWVVFGENAKKLSNALASDDKIIDIMDINKENISLDEFPDLDEINNAENITKKNKTKDRR